MGKVKFELTLKGLNEIMKGPQMQAVLDEKGAKIMNAANNMASANGNDKAEYSRSIWVGNWIAASQVRCDNSESVHDNYENNTLLKAINSGK